jgi:hypothetical protein
MPYAKAEESNQGAARDRLKLLLDTLLLTGN